MLRLEAVAVVLLPVQSLAGIGGELFGGIDIIRAVDVLAVLERAGVLLIEHLAVCLGYAAQRHGVALEAGKLPYRLDCRAQRPRAYRENEGGLALVTQFG